jgi:hypothetical protein
LILLASGSLFDHFIWKLPFLNSHCSVALYGLILFYGLTKDELKGRRPLAKFLCIKLIVMATFYQEFVVRLERNTLSIADVTASSDRCSAK